MSRYAEETILVVLFALLFCGALTLMVLGAVLVSGAC